jgi:hypothetical protein
MIGSSGRADQTRRMFSFPPVWATRRSESLTGRGGRIRKLVVPLLSDIIGTVINI